MGRFDKNRSQLLKPALISLAILLVLIIFGLLAMYGLGWDLEDIQRLSGLQITLLTLAVAPALGLLYLFGEIVAEAVLSLLCLLTFKIVTLGQIGFGDDSLQFNWIGLARDWDGALVASEALVMGIAFGTWAMAGLAAYYWWPA